MTTVAFTYRDIAKADAEGSSKNQLYQIQIIKQLLLDGCVDVVATLRKDGDNKRWQGP